MFVKFATAKNREKLNQLKLSTNRCNLPENSPGDMYKCLVCAPQLGFKPASLVRVCYRTAFFVVMSCLPCMRQNL